MKTTARQFWKGALLGLATGVLGGAIVFGFVGQGAKTPKSALAHAKWAISAMKP